MMQEASTRPADRSRLYSYVIIWRVACYDVRKNRFQ